jgi:hypothetical protein
VGAGLLLRAFGVDPLVRARAGWALWEDGTTGPAVAVGATGSVAGNSSDIDVVVSEGFVAPGVVWRGRALGADVSAGLEAGVWAHGWLASDAGVTFDLLLQAPLTASWRVTNGFAIGAEAMVGATTRHREHVVEGTSVWLRSAPYAAIGLSLMFDTAPDPLDLSGS